jgi:NitT/TauT family transport system ATP-binding protein
LELPQLELLGVSKSYPNPTGGQNRVLDTVTVRLARQEFVAIIGPSGCGKTTLLKIAAGLVRPSGGEVRANGLLGPLVRGSYGLVFQQPALLPWRSVISNIRLTAEVLGLDLREADIRAAELIELLRLPKDVAKYYPHQLSGGMQQRVAIARALVHDPQVLLMDEPFGALDAITRQQLNEELQDLHFKQRKTVLFVTHNISEAVYLADRVIVMGTRPGSILSEMDVGLPRPRSVETMLDQEARTLELSIHTMLMGH